MSRARASRRSLRVVTYNILLGGARREEHITAVLRRLDADVITLQEVSNPEFAAAAGARPGHGARHRRRQRRQRGQPRRAVAHPGASLAQPHAPRTDAAQPPRDRARDRRRRASRSCTCTPCTSPRASGSARRARSAAAASSTPCSATSAARRASPHLIAGDFNSLAPGDHLEATAFFARMAELRRAQVAGAPGQRAGRAQARRRGRRRSTRPGCAPGSTRASTSASRCCPFVVYPLTALLPRSRTVDRVLGGTIERWTVARMLEAGYVDCFRHLTRAPTATRAPPGCRRRASTTSSPTR